MNASPVVRIENVATPTPIYFLGDSHVLGYRNLSFGESFAGGEFSTTIRYRTGFAAAHMWSRGAVGLLLRQMLEQEELVKDGRAAHLSTEPIDLAAAFASGLPQAAPLIVVSCGDIDVRGTLLHEFRDDYDLILPDYDAYPATGRPPLPYDRALAAAERTLEPIVRGLKALHDIGLVRTYLHLLVPPTLDDDRFRELHGFACPRSVRYKFARLCNTLLARRCGELGLPTLDVWPDVTEAGYLKREFELDGVHLTREANLFSLRRLVDHALNNTAAIRNIERYRLLHELATRRTDHAYDPSTGLGSYGKLADPTADPVAPPRRSLLRRSLGKAKHLTLQLLSKPASRTPIAASVAKRPFSPPVVVAAAIKEPARIPVAERDGDAFFAAARRFVNEGVCSLDLGADIAERWSRMLAHDCDVGNRHARLDWSGNAITPYTPYIRAAEPTQDFLDDIRATFATSRFEDFFAACYGSAVTFLNCRSFASRPHEGKGVGAQSWHQDGCPPGLYRLLVYLTDVDEESGPFEYLGAERQKHAVTGPAGTLLMFDANRLLHRGSPPKRRERKVIDIVVAPRLPEEPFRVLWAGMNNWPADPFQYSVRGMIASPRLTGDEISLNPCLARSAVAGERRAA